MNRSIATGHWDAIRFIERSWDRGASRDEVIPGFGRCPVTKGDRKIAAIKSARFVKRLASSAAATITTSSRSLTADLGAKLSGLLRRLLVRGLDCRLDRSHRDDSIARRERRGGLGGIGH